MKIVVGRRSLVVGKGLVRRAWRPSPFVWKKLLFSFSSTVSAQLVGAEVEDVDGLGCDALRFWTCGDGMSSVSTGRVGRLRTKFGGGLCGLAFEARVEEFDFDA